jgi:hypothetical protein
MENHRLINIENTNITVRAMYWLKFNEKYSINNYISKVFGSIVEN